MNNALKNKKFIVFICLLLLCIVIISLISVAAMATSVNGTVISLDADSVEVRVTELSRDWSGMVFQSMITLFEGDRLLIYLSDAAWFLSDKNISTGDLVKIDFFIQYISNFDDHRALRGIRITELP